MSIVEFLKEFGEAFEDIKNEQEQQKAAMNRARSASKKRR